VTMPANDKYADARAWIETLGPEAFGEVMKLVIWAVKGCDEHDLELAYQDDEVMLFRRKVPFSAKLKSLKQPGSVTEVP
jgi:hypothetical protein